MGLCNSVPRTNSGRYGHSVSSPTASPQGGNVAQRRANSNQPGGPLSDLNNLNRGRTAASGSVAPRSGLSAGERAVTNALNVVRKQYYELEGNLKSSNKKKLGIRDQTDQAKELQRVEHAREEILRMREAALFDTDTNAVDVARDGKAHNCDELARIAAFVLQEDMGLIARVVDLVRSMRPLSSGQALAPCLQT